MAEVKKLRRKKNFERPASKNLREEYARTMEPLRAWLRKQWVEQEISQLVNTAYGLTDDEVPPYVADRSTRMPTPPGQM